MGAVLWPTMAGSDGSPTPDEIAVRAFSTVRRGLDPHEVRTFLESLARDKRAQQAQLGALEGRLKELEHQVAHPKVDEATIIRALGEETASLLSNAKDAARRIVSKAEEEAKATREGADAEALETRRRLDQERTETEEHVAAQRKTAQDEVAELRDAAIAEAARMREAAADAKSKAEQNASRVLAEAHSESTAVRYKAEEDTKTQRKEAQEEAEQIRVAAVERAKEIVTEARTEGEKIRTEAGEVLAERTQEAEAEADRICKVAKDEAAQAKHDASEAAEFTLSQAKEQASTIVGEAQSHRERILADLTRRRRTGQMQIEQLRVGRGRLLDAYDLVRRNLDEVTRELHVVEEEARAEAERVAREYDESSRANGPELDTMEFPSISVLEQRGEPEHRKPKLADNPAVVEEEHRLARLKLRHPDDRNDATPHQGLPLLEAPSGVEGVRVIPPAGDSSAPQDVDAGPVPDTEAAVEPDTEAAVEEEADSIEVSDPHQPATESKPDADGHDGDKDEPTASSSGTDSLPEKSLSSDTLSSDTLQEGEGREAAAEDDGLGAIPSAQEHADSDEGADVDAVDASDMSPATDVYDAYEVEAENEETAENPMVHDSSGGVRIAAMQVGQRATVDRSGEIPRITPAAAPESASHPSQGDSNGDRDDVDSLFARIRAEEPPQGEEQEDEADRQQAPTRRGPDGNLLDPADEAILKERDQAMAPLDELIGRRMKRVLQDMQNSVLNRMKARRPTPETVLGERHSMFDPLAEAITPVLADAAMTGARLAAPKRRSKVPIKTDDLVDEVCAAVVGAIRTRVEKTLSQARSFDDASVAAQINAIFRDWRGERVSRLGGDAVATAFARGAYVATPTGVLLRWVPDDGGHTCIDCDDNALAGPTKRGDTYPTGQRHPPAHSGCRCWLVRVEQPRKG